MEGIEIHPQLGVQYHDLAAEKNTGLKNLEAVRNSLGIDAAKWSILRPQLVEFISKENIDDIDLTKEKRNSQALLHAKIRGFTDSNIQNPHGIPPEYVAAGFKTMVLSLRSNLAKVKLEATSRPDINRHSKTPGTDTISASVPPTPTSDHPARTQIWIYRINSKGIIRSSQLYPFQLTISKEGSLTSYPSAGAFSLNSLRQALSEVLCWRDGEKIVWMAAGNQNCDLDTEVAVFNWASEIAFAHPLLLILEVRGAEDEIVRDHYPGALLLLRQATAAPFIMPLRRPRDVLEDGTDESSKRRRTSKSDANTSALDSGDEEYEEDKPGEKHHGEEQLGKVFDPFNDSQATAGLTETNHDQPPPTATDDLMNGAQYDPDDVNQTIQSALDTEACSQTGEHDARWKLGCELFKRNDPDDHSHIKIPGLLIDFFPHQIICVVWMLLQMISGCPGGYVADEMGYGKTIELLLFIYVCCTLVRAWDDVDQARARPDGGGDEHLPASTPDHPQDPHARCPSDKFTVQCPCQEWSFSHRLRCKLGPHLIVVPASMIDTWINNFHKIFGFKDRPHDMTLGLQWYGSTRASLKHLAVTKELEERCVVNDAWCPYVGQENIIILTTTNVKTFPQSQYKKTFRFTTLVEDAHGVSNEVDTSREADAVCWASISLDEAHKIQNASNAVITAIANTDRRFWRQSDLLDDRNAHLPVNSRSSVPNKFFLTGTPWERSPLNMEGHLHCLRQPGWSRPDSPFHGLTVDNFADLTKRHGNIIKAIENEQAISVSSTDCRKLITDIRSLLPLFMIRRTDESVMWGKRLIPLPPLHVDWRAFETPRQYREAITANRQMEAHKELTRYQEAYQNWAKKNQKLPSEHQSAKPAAPTSSMRKKAPNLRLRTVATFPALVDYLRDENDDLVPSALTIEDIDKRRDLFLRNLGPILDNSPKYQAILELIDGIWPAPNEPGHFRKGHDKLVVVSVFPIAAWLVTEGLRRRGLKADLFASTVSQSSRDWLAVAFQEDPDLTVGITPQPTAETTPFFLSGSSETIGLGLTLTRAHHLIKLDVDFLYGQDRQIVKRIWRIGQRQECFVWRFITIDNTEEVLVQRRQEVRGKIVSKSFALPTRDYDIPQNPTQEVDLTNEI
ncbi:MAG: hypothetical protein Q9204_002594 [Flavoplaca sp. TL-2023a]